MIIAGRTVVYGDVLYHVGLQAWLTVEALEGAAEAHLREPVSGRVFIAATGGNINGKRVLYWHMPLVLDLPFSDVAKYQRLLNAIIEEM